MELPISRKLDNWGHLFSIRRLRSDVSKEGYSYDQDANDYVECDQIFRARMTLELQERQVPRFSYEKFI